MELNLGINSEDRHKIAQGLRACWPTATRST